MSKAVDVKDQERKYQVANFDRFELEYCVARSIDGDALISALLYWKKENDSIVDENLVYHILFVCDVSGSMGHTLKDSNLSKCQVMKEGLKKTFKFMTDWGGSIKASVLLFDHTTKLILEDMAINKVNCSE